jgi:hypothetical protein
MPASFSEDTLIEQPAIALVGGDLLPPQMISGEVDVDRIRMKDEGAERQDGHNGNDRDPSIRLRQGYGGQAGSG